jgi:hypothetical protein
MYRDEADLELLAELAGVLDATVSEAGLSAATYLVLRELTKDEGPHEITALAEGMSAQPNEVADAGGRLVSAGLAETRPNGLVATRKGRTRAEVVESSANEAMRAHVLERPHSATVYGLVAAMQAGRFSVEDLIEFLAEGPDGSEE